LPRLRLVADKPNSPISKRLTKLGYTFKKKSFHPKEQENPNVIKERELWRNIQPNLQTAKRVFLDENSINMAYTRLYGRAKATKEYMKASKSAF